MNNIVAFVCERLRHVEWSAGPEPHVASIADRDEGDPSCCLAARYMIPVHFVLLPESF
jgi:hypothetical protein